MRINWLEPARERIDSIFDYLKPVAGIRVARKVVRDLYARPGILIRNPLAGPREESVEDQPEGYRYLVEGNYKIIYFVDGDQINIATVWDCRMDPAALADRLSTPSRQRRL